MKTMKYLFAVIAALLAFASCEEDGDKIYLQSLSDNELMASTSDVTLSPDAAQQIVLSFAWTDQTIAVSDENVGTAAKVVTSLEASLSEDFSGTVSRTETTSLSHAFTGAALNTVANAIGATVGQANTVWFRLGSATGTNIPPAYSNVVKVSVTPYEMDMNTGKVLLSDNNNANLGETGVTFHSPDADGIYSGFISIPYGWYHILFQEGNGLIWGTAGNEGAFHITSDAANNRQNMWFPEAAGCYYVTVNTQEEEWSALHISSLTVSGLTNEDVTMSFDKENNQWIATFTADATGPRTITVTGQGEQYNVTTGDGSGEATVVAFAAEGESLVLAETAGSISVEVPQAGECTLRLNLSDPKNCTASVEAGGAEIPEEPEIIHNLYVMGVNGTDYSFTQSIPLYDNTKLSYAGVLNTNPDQWGYYFYTANNWDNQAEYKYGTDLEIPNNTSTSGTLIKNGANIPKLSSAGLYFFEASLSNMNYRTILVGDKIYYAGLNDDWNHKPMNATETLGEYTANITISSPSPWGIQIFLLSTWEENEPYWGGSNGTLYYKGENIKDDQTLEAGNYTLTVNLLNRTYSYTKQ